MTEGGGILPDRPGEPSAQASTGAAEPILPGAAAMLPGQDDMARAQASENKEALERERERADALADALASIRTEVESLKTLGGAMVLPLPGTTTFLPRLAVPLVLPMEPQAPAEADVPDEADVPGGADVSAPERTAPEERATGAPSPARAAGLPADARRRLTARAEELLKAGDISGARLLLERALEGGEERAALLLAQTYDPAVLSTWRNIGVRGDEEKARALYRRAEAAGIAVPGEKVTGR